MPWPHVGLSPTVALVIASRRHGGGGAIGAASGPSTTAPHAPTPADIGFDYLMRPTPGEAAAAPTAGATQPQPMAWRLQSLQELQPSVVRVLGDGLQAGTLAPADRSYLASLVSRRTGMSQADAEKRVDEAFQRTKDANVKAKAAADKARKASVLAAFLAAATLVIGCAAACAGATAGGRHRDEQTEIRLFGTRQFW
jgi:hypothetical protein